MMSAVLPAVISIGGGGTHSLRVTVGHDVRAGVRLGRIAQFLRQTLETFASDRASAAGIARSATLARPKSWRR
jgi:hypothetical protein